MVREVGVEVHVAALEQQIKAARSAKSEHRSPEPMIAARPNQKPDVVVASNPGQMNEHLPAWESLAESSIEPNVFYEPWMLMPAVNHLAGDSELHFVFVYLPDRQRPNGPALLCGMFPLERTSRAFGAIGVLSLWKHVHCFLCTPLIRRGYGKECLDAFFDWLATEPFGASLMEFKSIGGDGAFHRLLVDRFFEHGSISFESECHSRALFRPDKDADVFLRSALAASTRKELRRKLNRLAEEGRIEWSQLGAKSDLSAWINEFLQLESGGWKGRAGDAIECDHGERAFFIEMCEAAFQRGALRVMSLNMNGRSIAQRWYFTAGEGAFAFKTAFDEGYARRSPGVLLQVEQVRQLHNDAEIAWMDSCSAADSHLNRIWKDRRAIESIVVGTGGRKGDLLVAMMPLVRWLARKARFRRVGSRAK